MRRVVISGITGFLGHELTRQLARAGATVHGLTQQDVSWPLIDTSAQLHRVDGRTETLIQVLDAVRPDTVFHLAALARREHLSEDIIPFVHANVLFGTQLLEAMRLSGCRRFVTAGSYLQYSDKGASRPLNLYAAMKHAFEQILAYYVDAYSISAARLVVCNIYGEADKRPQLVTDIVAACLDGTPLKLHAEEGYVDLVHVEDAAAAFLQVVPLLEDAGGSNELYSITSGRDISASELVALVTRLSSREVTIQREKTLQAGSRRPRPWRGMAVPGWDPRVTIEEGIRRLLAKAR